MGDWIDHVVYHVGSGNAFFFGTALILLGITASAWTKNRWLRLARNLLILIGAIAIAISATPLPWWAYAILGVCTLTWLVIENTLAGDSSAKRRLGRVGLAAVWLLVAGVEVPYQIGPTLPCLGNPKLFLIGDSVSAGMSEAEKETWPKLVARTHPIELRDFSKMGATVGSARKQAERIGDEPGLVLLEIGGNDVLASTTPEEFEERLDSLLTDVCRRERTVVMVELPLPPFANRFGMIQRRLAEQYQVTLIPKRKFIGVLTTAGATVDGVHLSAKGHALMAKMMWAVLRSAYDEDK